MPASRWGPPWFVRTCWLGNGAPRLAQRWVRTRDSQRKMKKVRESESKGKWGLLLPAQPWASESLGCRRAPTSSLAAREHLGPRNTGSLPQLSAGLLQGQPPGVHRSDGPQPVPRVPASHCPGPKGRGSPFRRPPQRVRGQQTGSGKGGQGLGVPQGGGPPSAHSPGTRPRAAPCPSPSGFFGPHWPQASSDRAGPCLVKSSTTLPFTGPGVQGAALGLELLLPSPAQVPCPRALFLATAPGTLSPPGTLTGPISGSPHPTSSRFSLEGTGGERGR